METFYLNTKQVHETVKVKCEVVMTYWLNIIQHKWFQYIASRKRNKEPNKKQAAMQYLIGCRQYNDDKVKWSRIGSGQCNSTHTDGMKLIAFLESQNTRMCKLRKHFKHQYCHPYDG